MSRVFVATETALGRRVAIKVLSPDVAGAVNAERFRREIQLVAQLQHPHIVPVHASGEAAGTLFYTMPFVDGESLRARLRRHGQLPLDEAVSLLGELADALAYAHARGVVHRDIKPENVLLSGSHAMLADFGIAKALSAATGAGHLTSAGLVLGTPAYMAPEQIAGDARLDARADLYSLGLVAYEMVAGALPFEGNSPAAMLAAHISASPPSLALRRGDAPPALVALVMDCLEKDPGRRPQTAAEIATGLRTLGTLGTLGTTGALGTPGARGARAERPAVRSSWSVRSRSAVIAVGLIILAWGAALLVRRSQHTDTNGSSATGIAGAVAAVAAVQSIAVLPLESASGDSASAYFADGVTDDLASALAKVPGLRVAPRTSVQHFKARGNLTVRQIGESLHVAAVLEGRIRRSENIVRVNAQLTSTSDGLGLWSDSFDSQQAGLFAMQDKLTGAIVGALRPALGGSAAVSHGTRSVAAYDHYLKGRFFWNQRTHESFTAAIREFGDAVGLDSSYALAYAGLADSWALEGTFGYVRPLDAFPKARVAAERAVLLDGTLAEPHVSLGEIAEFFDWDWARAEREFATAEALNPAYAQTFLFRAWLRMFRGRGEEALASVRHARELEPLNLTINARVGSMLWYLGRNDEAEREMRATLALDSTFFVARDELAAIMATRGRFGDATRIMAPSGATTSPIDQNYLAYFYAKAGRRKEAMLMLNSLRAQRASRYVTCEAFVITYGILGDLDAAFAELERGVSERDWAPLAIGFDPGYAPLWKDPRIRAIRRRTHLDDVAPINVAP